MSARSRFIDKKTKKKNSKFTSRFYKKSPDKKVFCSKKSKDKKQREFKLSFVNGGDKSSAVAVSVDRPLRTLGHEGSEKRKDER